MDASVEIGGQDGRRAVVLMGSPGGSSEVHRAAAVVARQLEHAGWSIETVDLEARRIATCNGCFECWVKTPGVCRIRDYNRELAERVIGSGLLILVSRVRFGSYDAEVQGAMEHMIPLISPFFRSVDGETHHAPRYDRYPSFGAVGIHDADDEAARIFRTRIARIAVNFFSPSHAAIVVPGSPPATDLDRAVSGLFGTLGAGA